MRSRDARARASRAPLRPAAASSYSATSRRVSSVRSHETAAVGASIERPSSYGAKLTGAGGGGRMFALTDRPSKTAEAIRAAGGKSFVVQADSRGVAKIG